jgi:hypothetical protein
MPVGGCPHKCPHWLIRGTGGTRRTPSDLPLSVEAMGIEPTNLLHAMQALYQLSYAPRRRVGA